MSEYLERARQWFHSKIDLASRLARGELGGSYGDAVLVLSSLISGIAAELWPGEGFDRKRFVEVWSRYAAPNLFPNRISLPLLVADLRGRDRGLAERARQLRAACISEIPQLDTLVVTGERVDVSEDEVTVAMPELANANVRAFSYGNIFYREFRSGYVHAYKIGRYADAVIMSHTRGDITYSNCLQPPHRRINFDSTWLASVARSIADASLQHYWAGAQPPPSRWWVEG